MQVPAEPLARGVIVPIGLEHGTMLAVLAKEMTSILRAHHAEARVTGDIPKDADFVVLLVEADADVTSIELPPMKDRVGSSLSLAEVEKDGRVANMLARKHLRANGASLGARELVFSPKDFGYLGIESDNLRERLEGLLEMLVVDAERLRLRREGWEEADAEEST